MASVRVRPGLTTVRTRAMGSAISIAVDEPFARDPVGVAALGAALELFGDVDRECTRFDQASPLMRANDAGLAWTSVGPLCFEVIAAAHAAHRRTSGRFDPRVLADLVRLGYDRSMSRGGTSARTSAAHDARPELPPWVPAFDPAGWRVQVGPVPIDLGGIGKGFAVRQAATLLAAAGGCLIDAGGDCWAGGAAPGGDRWRLGVEDPTGGTGPVAVLAVEDRGVATSSIRVSQWEVAGKRVHHLIDPSTGQPGGCGLAAVTVVAGDTMTAEIASKVHFLEGAAGIAAAAARSGVAALWVRTDGSIGATEAMAPYVIWRRDQGRG